MEAVSSAKISKSDTDAVLGLVEEPPVRLSKALDICTSTVWAEDLKKKSPQQLRKWKAIPARAVARFVSVVSDNLFRRFHGMMLSSSTNSG